MVIICRDNKLEKQVENISHYKSIEKMVEDINFKRVMPFVNSVNEMKEVYHNFPDYKEKKKNTD